MTDGREEQKLKAWIESKIGGIVERITRQKRWRPSWYVDLRKDGQILPLYIRGDRNESFPEEPIEYEYAVLKALEQADIPVPHCYGICPDPHGIVMERVSGNFNLLKNVDSEENRLSVLEHLAEIQAKFYKLDVEPLIAAGMKMPTSKMQALSPVWFAGNRIYERSRKLPDPRVEFIRTWIMRNAPAEPSKIAFLHGDAAQFMFEGGRITAMVDFEIAALGDPIMDMASTRIRATYEPMGDMRAFYKRLFELTGAKVDLATLGFHTVAWMSVSQTFVVEAIQSPKTEANTMEYLSWYVDSFIIMLETIAEVSGLELDPADPLPSIPPRWNFPRERLDARLASADGDGTDYERELDRKYLEFLHRMTIYGPALDADYVNAASKIVGRDLAGWQEADRVLEEMIPSLDPDHQDSLVRMFYTWARRQRALYHGLASGSVLDVPFIPLREIVSQ